MTKFVEPDFASGELELRFENNEICIYGTVEGLKKLARLCSQLIEQPSQQHIHLDSLTQRSTKGTIALFENRKIADGSSFRDARNGADEHPSSAP